jgi:phage tail sheath gpL-like
MSVSFNNVPSNLRLPLFSAEVNNSQANSGSQTQRTLIVGQITSAGNAVAGVPVICAGVTDAKAKGGPGSLLHLLTQTYMASDSFAEVWLLPLADAVSSLAAKGSLLVSSAPTADGVISLYLGGNLVSVVVSSTDTPTTVAADIVAQVNANLALPVTAAVDGTVPAKVNLTAKNAGLCGNDIDIRLNYRGTVDGEALPPGLGLTIVAMAGGATNPVLDMALSALGDEAFDFIVSPYTDTASLDSLKSLLNDTTGRWSWTNQVYGHVFAAKCGTYATLTTFGNARNNQHESVLGVYDSPSPSWLWAADYAGAAAVALRADPGRPLQTLTLSTVLPPPHASRFTAPERNTLLWDGISTFTVGMDGTVAVENIITTYQLNSYGEADDSYLQVETLFLLMYVLRAQKSVITSRFPRMKLGVDGGRYAAGSNVVTPSDIRGELIADYQEQETDGFVQNSALFAQALIVEQDSTNPNRVNVLWPAELIDQLRVLALLAQFRL